MPSTVFTVYDSASDPLCTNLVNALLGPSSGVQLVGSASLSASGPSAVHLYDGSLSPLGIGAGLLLTSGTTPGMSNTVGWFGQDNTNWSTLDPATGLPINFYNGNSAIDAVVNTVFQTQSYDATTLSFNFTVSDPAATSISFDVVFGSDEYPEWVDQFVDCAVVIVNGVNYALFNHDPNAPLSVISPNLAAGYFQDNAGNILPIEYDGVSHVLKIVAPIKPGEVNSIMIGITDTGDHIYDSGIFISNLTAGTTPGSGVVLTPDVPCTNGDDVVTGSLADELVILLGGDDVAYAGGGDDIVVGGTGNDKIYGGSGNDVLEGDEGNDYLDGGEGTQNQAVYKGNSASYTVTYDFANDTYTVVGPEGTDTLKAIQLVKFADGLFDLSTSGLAPHVSDSGPVANLPGSVIISGAAVVGQTLSAIVVDGDGVPTGGLSYDWFSSADGVTWTSTGVFTKAYKVGGDDAGNQLKVEVSYVDNAGHAEAPASGALAVAATNGLSISLVQISAPAGAGVENPLTTLLNNAVTLGFSANEATVAIKTVLGLPPIDIKTYDPVAVLNLHPAAPVPDAMAFTVLKICAELAMAASVSDPTMFNLTLAVMDAAAHANTINLASSTQLASLLDGIGATELGIVQTTNKDMADAFTVAQAMAAWNDFCGNTDGMEAYQNSFEWFDAHLNQAPVGYSTATLPEGSLDNPYMIVAADLLSGFSDPDGDALNVVDIVPNGGGVIYDNGDGTWTFWPSAGFTGPVEISFTVGDISGAMVAGSSLFVIAGPPDNVIVGTPDADILVGTMGVDVISGLPGDDVIVGADAVDHLDGGEGSDLYVIDAAIDHPAAEFTDTGLVGVDEVRFTATTADTLTLFGSDTGIERVVIGTGMGVVAVTSGSTANNIDASQVVDAIVLVGNAGANLLAGGQGDDTLTGNAGIDTFVVDAGVDTVTDLGKGGADILHVSAGATVEATVAVAWNASAATSNEGTVEITTSGLSVNLAAVVDTTLGKVGYHVINVGAATTLVGSALADWLTGGTGNDTLIGNGGDDIIDGGAGSNVSAYSGSARNYMITAAAGSASLIVQDRTDMDGTDTLWNIQTLEFTDASVDSSSLVKAASLTAQQIASVTDIYIASFNRAPDSLGLVYWAGQLKDRMTLEAIAKSFFVQPETAAKYPASTTDTDFVTTVYGNVLGRAPDPDGLEYWVGQLDRGFSRDKFLLAILNGAHANPSATLDIANLNNKVAVGEHFALAQGLSNGMWSQNVMAGVTSDTATVTAANTMTDSYAAIAAAPETSELVVKILGIVS